MRTKWIKREMKALSCRGHKVIQHIGFTGGYRIGFIEECESEGWLHAFVEFCNKSNRNMAIHPRTVAEGKAWIEKETFLLREALVKEAKPRLTFKKAKSLVDEYKVKPDSIRKAILMFSPIPSMSNESLAALAKEILQKKGGVEQ